MQKIIDLTEQEIKDIKLVRNYFTGDNDVSSHQHFCYAVLDNLLKKLNVTTVNERTDKICEHKNRVLVGDYKDIWCNDCNTMIKSGM